MGSDNRMENLSPELRYALLVVALFVVPRVLQRLRLPSAITCLALGAAATATVHWFHGDTTVPLLATFGIVAMFLFAGLEVDFLELRKGAGVLFQHVAVQLLMLSAGTVAMGVAFGLEPRAALLYALALFTPSTGFILDSLGGFGLTPEERFWVKSKAIASELVALGVLFVTVQSQDTGRLAVSAGVLFALVAVLPWVFKVFAKVIVPFAPNTEFSFLVIVALLCAFITRELGVYYLVGAFVVGVTAVRLRRELPALSSERLLGAVELFASFFIPFYFFKAGLHVTAQFFSLEALGIGLVLLVVVLPARVARVALHRKLALGESWRTGARIGTAVLPTLVFSIVIGEILLEQFALEPRLFGALLVFTVVNTIVPGIVLRAPTPEFETPTLPTLAKSSSP
ncbi:MAG: cation:proton antiporter [Archangiaceae bacterium]|nr:cation:proton antiporter [Archangiaceae bacterium]